MPEYLSKFITHIGTIQGKSPRTVQAYKTDLSNFLRFILVAKGKVEKPKNFAARDVDEAIAALREVPLDLADINLIKSITLDDLYEFMAYANNERGNNNRTRSRKTACLHTFFKFLHGILHVIDVNPAELLTSPKIGKSLPVHLSLNEAESLLNAAKDINLRDYAMLVLFLNCGMRLSEIVSINISDIREGTLTVTGKGNKQRTIYLNSFSQTVLKEYIPVRNALNSRSGNALFLNKNGERISGRSVERIVDKYLKLAGLDSNKYSPHKLRHTAATLMYQHGHVDIRALQEILGHEQLTTTELYTHINQEQLMAATNANPLNKEK